MSMLTETKEAHEHRNGVKMDAAVAYDDPDQGVMDALYAHACWLVQHGYESCSVTKVVDRALAREAGRRYVS